MGIFELFSHRQKKLSGFTPDPYQYTILPEKLRVQIIHIWRSSVGFNTNLSKGFWTQVHDTLCRETGKFSLDPKSDNTASENCISFLLNAQNDETLDLIDLSFNFIHIVIPKLSQYQKMDLGATQSPENAIEELNARFKENSVGYQFESGRLVRIDSEVIHQEIIKPSLKLLHDNNFKGAEEEFLKAHEHYRHGRYKESIADALKSFESTMKTICSLRKWTYKPSDTSNKLIEILITKELVPSYLQQQFTSLRSTLETGIPVIRNKTSGHGQGEQPVIVPEYYVSYALNLSASCILFLVECHLKYKGPQ